MENKCFSFILRGRRWRKTDAVINFLLCLKYYSPLRGWAVFITALIEALSVVPETISALDLRGILLPVFSTSGPSTTLVAVSLEVSVAAIFVSVLAHAESAKIKAICENGSIFLKKVFMFFPKIQTYQGKKSKLVYVFKIT
jgi:hypothetical protein